MPLPPLPTAAPEALPLAARRLLVGGMAAAHLATGWALLQWQPVRQALGEAAPLIVDLVAPTPPAPPPAPPLRLRTPTPPPPKPPVVSEAPPAPAEPVFVAPPSPPVETPPPAPATLSASPPPAAPAAPRTIAITAVEYLTPPVLHYPLAARRLRESGHVEVRVLVDVRGLPGATQVLRSSGSERLDEAALATVRATRFKPYTENGVAQPFWVVMPLSFDLE